MIFVLSVFYCFIISFVMAVSFFFLYFIAKLITSVILKKFLPDDNETIFTVAFVIVIIFLFVVGMILF